MTWRFGAIDAMFVVRAQLIETAAAMLTPPPLSPSPLWLLDSLLPWLVESDDFGSEPSVLPDVFGLF